MLRASTVEVTDTPIAAPILRSRLNSDAPSVRSAGGNVAKASTCSGVNDQAQAGALQDDRQDDVVLGNIRRPPRS